MDRKRAALRPHLNVTYTKQYKEGDQKSTSKLVARNLEDAAYIAGPVVFGNAGVAIVKFFETVFDTEHKTQWFKPLHKQRMEERPYRGLKPRYKDEKFRWEAEANHRDAQIEKANRSDEQKKFEAQLQIFNLVGARLEADPENAGLLAAANGCVLNGLRDMATKGLIPEAMCNVVASDGQPGIYPVNLAHAYTYEWKLTGDIHDPVLRDQCKAAIVERYIKVGLATGEMLEKAEYPKNEQDRYPSSESDQEQFEISSSNGSSGGVPN